jgi:hypothetical protein
MGAATHSSYKRTRLGSPLAVRIIYVYTPLAVRRIYIYVYIYMYMGGGNVLLVQAHPHGFAVGGEANLVPSPGLMLPKLHSLDDRTWLGNAHSCI